MNYESEIYEEENDDCLNDYRFWIIAGICALINLLIFVFI